MYPIPANATRIRDLESTGTQWIDTGVAPDNNELDFIIDFENRRSGTALAAAFGCRQLTSAYSTGSYAVFLRSNEGDEGRIDIANTGVAKWMSFLVGVRYTIAWDSAAKQLTKTRVDTGNSTTASAGQKTLCEYPFILGGINTAGAISSSGAEMRIHSARFWKSGVLVRDYVPLRVGTTGYLFDRVSGQLFGNAADNNAGFPAECLGPDVFSQGVVPTRMMAMGVRKRPYDAEVEWIVNGTIINQVGNIACVDTGIDSGDNVGFEVDVTRVNETTSDSVIFGSRYSSGDTRYFVGAQVGGKYYWGWNGRIDSQTLTLNAKHTLGLNYLNSRKATFDGTQVGSLSGTYTNAKRLYFCAYNTQAGVIGGGSSWRCHGGRISVGSTIVRRYKPVRIGTTGYWYEEISGMLYASQAGVFIVGPDKSA